MTSKLQTTLTDLHFDGSDPTTNFIHIIHNLLSPTECNILIKLHQSFVPSNVSQDTIRFREQFDDDALSQKLWGRLKPFYEEDRVKDEEGYWWKANGLNERFRLCRYDKGGKFAPHHDARRMADLDNQSFMTVNIYLNTVPESLGGSTRALGRPDSAAAGIVLAKIQPVLGTAAVFRDTLWHDGEELTDGVKYLLRTDVMYGREEPLLTMTQRMSIWTMRRVGRMRSKQITAFPSSQSPKPFKMDPILQTTLTDLHFDGSDPTTNFIHIIHDLLSPIECQILIQSHKNLVPSNVTRDTIRFREQFDDDALSSKLWERLRSFYGEDRIKDEDGYWWKATSLNERFRLCRYDKGGKFSPHYDGRRMADLDTQSFMTVNIYLNTVPDTLGGATRALGSLDSATPGKVLATIQPVLGTAAVFRDTLWHDGEGLTSGVKYLLRTDVIYEREEPFDFDTVYGHLDDEGRGKKAMFLAECLEDAGNGSEATKWYKKAIKLLEM